MTINDKVKTLVDAFNTLNEKSCAAVKVTQAFLHAEQYKEAAVSIKEVKVLLKALSTTMTDLETTISDEHLA